MNDTDVRDLLARVADEVPATPVDPEPLLRRGYRRMARTAVAGAVGIACRDRPRRGGRRPDPFERADDDPGRRGAADRAAGDRHRRDDRHVDRPVSGFAGRTAAVGVLRTARRGDVHVAALRARPHLHRPGRMEQPVGHARRVRPLDAGVVGRVGRSADPGIYLLDHPGLSVRRDPRPDEGCSPHADATVGTSAIEVATWVANHPAIATKAPSPVEVGGLSGYQLDVSLADTWQKSCPGRRGVAVRRYLPRTNNIPDSPRCG